jgi:RimJ/RimL family protein N-acetyltransferase
VSSSNDDVATVTGFDAIAWPLQTQRLSIRRALTSDDDAMWRYWRLDHVSRWNRRRPADFRQFQEALPLRLDRTLVLELNGEVVGDMGLGIQDAWAQREVAAEAIAAEGVIGYSLHPAVGGRGLATEAVRELLRLCFEDLSLRRVSAEAYLANERSVRLLYRVGMRRESHQVRAALHRDLGWMDLVQHALLAEEWSELHRVTRH